MQALVPYKRDPGLFDQGPFSYQCYQRCKGSCGIGGVFLRDRFSSPMARIALAKSRSEHTIRLPKQLPFTVISTKHPHCHFDQAKRVEKSR